MLLLFEFAFKINLITNTNFKDSFKNSNISMIKTQQMNPPFLKLFCIHPVLPIMQTVATQVMFSLYNFWDIKQNMNCFSAWLTRAPFIAF